MSSDDQKDRIIESLRAYILANDARRKNPCGLQSCPPRDTPIWKEYKVLSEAAEKAYSNLWMETDINYSQDGFRDVVWTWRRWKLESLKCCWFQLEGKCHWRAGFTMRKLQEAETKLVEVCGLTSIYRTSCSYLEEAFPGLKKHE